MPSHTRRDFLKAAGATGATLLAGQTWAAEAKPNIVLIMADDLGYGDLGCYGGTHVDTPHIDALAAAGARFADFHANAPVCSPTRAALLTGRYQQRCGVEGVVTAKGELRHTGMALEETTFAEVLKTAGYATGLFGKWHLGYDVQFNPRHQGFDEFRGYVSGNVDYHSHIDGAGIEDWWDGLEQAPEDGYTTDLITDHGVRFIERHRDKPFCLYLPHEAPHFPYQGRRDKPGRKPGNPGPSHGSRQDKTGAYKEMIEALDDGVGRVVETVRRLGLERRTFIFFCSDNGATPVGSNAPLAGHKSSLWEGGHRVPAIACWPGRIPLGSVVDDPAMSMDLFPTMTGLAGVSEVQEMKLDGMDLGPRLCDGTPLAERTLFWRFGEQQAVRKGPWKLLVNPKGPERKSSRFLLNLDEDLGEQHDLASERPDVVEELQIMFDAWAGDVTAGVERRT